MKWLCRLFRRNDRYKDAINLDLIPEIKIGVVSDVTFPRGAFRRKMVAEERVRVTMTMKKSTFEALRKFCNEANTNASQTIRASFRYSEPTFRAHPKLIKEFDE